MKSNKILKLKLDAGNFSITTPASIQVVYGEKIGPLPTVEDSTIPFDGWYDSAIGGVMYTENTLFSKRSNVTLYAHYQTAQVVYNIGYPVATDVVAKLYSRGSLIFSGNGDIKKYTYDVLLPEFSGNSNIKSVSFEANNSISPSSLSSLFFDLPNLASVDFTNFNSQNVKLFDYMFYKCGNLSSVIGIENINTSKATTYKEMFNGCISLSNINLLNLVFNDVTDCSNMFNQCNRLKTSLKLNSLLVDVSYTNMFVGCATDSNAKVEVYCTLGSESVVDKIIATKSPLSNIVKIIMKNTKLKNGPSINTIIKGITTPFTSINFESSIPLLKADIIKYDISLDNDMSAIIYVDDLSVLHFCSDVIMTANENSSMLFDKLSLVKSISFNNMLDTSLCTDMSNMFRDCWGLLELDVSSFNTSNVKDMTAMFYKCTKLLEPLALSNFKTSNVTIMKDMFSDCWALQGLDLSSFDTRNVVDMTAMFYGCESFTSLDLDNFTTYNVTSMKDMFWNCKKLKDLDVSSFNTSNVTNMSGMFRMYTGLNILGLSNFNTSYVVDMSHMFEYCSYLETLNLSGFNTSNVTNMSFMFWWCSRLKSLDISWFETNNVTNMEHMFSDCKFLTSLDLSSFDTSKVTDMEHMFSDCKFLTSLDLSSFDTSKVTDMGNMFYKCNILTTEFSILNTLTDYSSMFYEAATIAPAKITVDYNNKTSSMIDTYIDPKSPNSNIVKGINVDL